MGYKYAERQFQLRLAQAMRAQAEIVSGAYKLTKVLVGPSSKPEEQVELTDDELLQRKLAEMRRHLALAQDTSDFLCEEEEAGRIER